MNSPKHRVWPVFRIHEAICDLHPRCRTLHSGAHMHSVFCRAGGELQASSLQTCR